MKWTSVKDRLPEGKGFVSCIVYTGDVVMEGLFNARTKNFLSHKASDLTDAVTHWMPLPDPPDNYEKLQRWESLAIRAIMTIRKNKDRGSIASTHQEEFEKIIKKFEDEMKDIAEVG